MLNAAMAAADAILTRAGRAGMLVDEGRAALREAREHQVNARVLVHAFAAPPLTEITGAGWQRRAGRRMPAIRRCGSCRCAGAALASRRCSSWGFW